MAFDDLAERHVHEVAILVDHRVERVEFAEHAHDLELLLVQRIADEVALDGERVLHEAGGMEGADRFVVRDAGRDHLAAAGPAGGRKVMSRRGASRNDPYLHSARFMEDPLAVQCNLVGNPLHEEQLEIGAHLALATR